MVTISLKICMFLSAWGTGPGVINHLFLTYPVNGEYTYSVSYGNKNPIQVVPNRTFMGEVTMECAKYPVTTDGLPTYVCDASKVKVLKKENFTCTG